MAPLSRGVMSVFCNVIKPQGLEPFQFSTKISSPSRSWVQGEAVTTSARVGGTLRPNYDVFPNGQQFVMITGARFRG